MLQQRQKSVSNINIKNSYKPPSSKSIELQINVSIGKNKYLLQVQKCSNLHQEVEMFLKTHGLNSKYEGPILAMVRQELTKKDAQKQSQCEKIQQLQKIKTLMDNKKKLILTHQQKEELEQKELNDSLWNNTCLTSQIRYFRKQDKQNYSSQLNSKHGISQQAQVDNLKKDLPKNQQKQQEDTKCQNVYQKWKVKQKIKQKQRIKNAKTPNKLSKQKKQSKSPLKNDNKLQSKSQKKLEVHEPDYFYNKGQKFKYAKEVHVENLYKQKYPFQIHKELSLTPTKKTQLHERLFKYQKIKQTMKIQKQIEQKMVSKQKKPIDKYKQKVIQRDSKLNQTLGYLLQNKMIQNPYKIEKVSKSPFRKTNCY